MQLNSLGIQFEGSLREELVEYVQTHPFTHDGLREYISAPIANQNAINADTELPNEQEEIINSTEASATKIATLH